MTRTVRRTTTGLLGLAICATAAVAFVGAPSQAASSKALNGTFRLAPGKYSGGKASGTWFRMITSRSGAKTQYLANPDSSAKDKTYTLGKPGRDGGLATGRFQPHPDPAFDGKGNALANKIVLPQPYTAIRFSVATLKRDPQSKKTVTPPSASVSGRRLTVRLPGFTAEWNKQYFNQGSPKPDGSTPGLTTPAKGTYNASTGAFVLEWSSTILGGPFNEFTGYWHLEVTFKTAGSPGGSPTKATTVAGGGKAATTTTVASQVAGEDASNTTTTLAESTGHAKVVGAVKQKGWKPPAWLIVVTALVGVLAALVLLVPTAARKEGATE